jgi:cyclopropane-fatty-acyl-phospholipid synthase
MGATVAEKLRPVITALFGGGEPPIRIRAWDGSELGGSRSDENIPTLVLRNKRALRRIVWAPNEVGLARAFVSGDLAVDGDFIGALDRILHLFDTSGGLRLTPEDYRSILASAIRVGALGVNPEPPAEEYPPPSGRAHSLRRDAASISHHYDVGNDFYERVLGESMVYSCAYWRDLADPAATLEQAQRDKLELICRKLQLKPGDRMLDVGCGWGSLAMHAAAEYGVRVVGVTISHEQAVAAGKRVAAAGLSDLVEIREQDYRTLDDGPFDAIASVGMAEHVGEARWNEYASDLFALLKPGGRLLNHQITEPPKQPVAATTGLAALRGKVTGVVADKLTNPERTFITAYVFPDGELFPVGWVSDQLETAGFEVRDVESLREHYARTLRCWVQNLETHWEECVEQSSLGRARVWRLYMAASALAFERNRVSIHQILAVRPDRQGRSHMPSTRAGFLTVD